VRAYIVSEDARIKSVGLGPKCWVLAVLFSENVLLSIF